ncbi:site-2 protease family protein [Pseudarthrobacter sp. J75]|uniref:site-2 protease family protein n=1 Tax=unclassified Pseudarthrobacter TaxID=2647000 RepID=UPI002E7FE349|nr:MULTISPECIES: site-2 protease family protein [unclassified Pseudarthrobacter]MEE2523107.1 site-2 protease family protein [Pseudarthrobacter sp. J47]MEE2529790.1 site-2 protease family protein [Pseudarthrobacter sp. J75]MEE2569106.1 site-2 protease family protein [Pseudarthrobacter sp. J64]
MAEAPPGPGAASKREGISLGRIAGIPVILAYSWFIIAAFMVVAGGPVLAARNPVLGVMSYYVAFAYAVLLLISVLVHELAHALSAKVYGWPTRKIVLTLMGGHTQFENFTASPGRSVVVALAGPAANFLLAGVAGLVLMALPQLSVAAFLAEAIMWANFLIAIFNVLPGLPLDGGRIVESLVWKMTGSQAKGTVAAGWGGRIIVIALVVWFIVLPHASGRPVDLTLVVVTVLVCGFLWVGASAAIRQGSLRGRLHLVNAGALAMPAKGLAASATAGQARAASAGGAAVVICGPDGRPAAVVDRGALAAVPSSVLDSTPVTAVSYPLAPGAYVPESASGPELIQYLSRLTGEEYAVINQRGDVTGLLGQAAVLTALTGKPGPRK